MANPPCPWCGSRQIRQDRSLAGRAVCGSCGRPRQSGRGGAPPRAAGRRQGRRQQRRGRQRLLWLLPIGLVLVWLWLRR